MRSLNSGIFALLLGETISITATIRRLWQVDRHSPAESERVTTSGTMGGVVVVRHREVPFREHASVQRLVDRGDPAIVKVW